MSKEVSVLEMIQEMKLNCINIAREDKIVKESDINRPGMQLVGYYQFFPYERIQVIGNAEYAYLQTLSNEEMLEKLDTFMTYNFPMLCVTRGHKISEAMISLAKKHDRFLVQSDLPTTKFISKISGYINNKTAPVEVTHGVLVDVDGLGILIKGDSGIGKSEAALELIKRGHRLVSDDAVEIKKLEDDMLVGQSPEITQYMMEIRGIGLLDIKSLYGVGAVKPSKTIDLVAYLENWDENKYYDRLGMDEEYMEILGVKVPLIMVPVKPGRNIAVILEIAARNQRQKFMGYNAAVEFNKKLITKLAKESRKNKK
ncbi:MAG: HPr(Ser) kinase/phosphatase [Peptostreptococcaceae bacterium]|nr:HPr(Ser) kinase/phosphatase [Peptostreptococcaceae bacterium]